MRNGINYTLFTFPIFSYYSIDPTSVQLFYSKNAPKSAITALNYTFFQLRNTASALQPCLRGKPANPRPTLSVSNTQS